MHQSRHLEGGAGPDFLNLLIGGDERTIRSNAVDGAHGAICKFQNIEGVDFLERTKLHSAGNEIAEAGHVGVPLSSELVSLDIVAIFAVGVVAEIFAIPKFLDIAGLALVAKIVVMLCGSGI